MTLWGLANLPVKLSLDSYTEGIAVAYNDNRLLGVTLRRVYREDIPVIR
jgi:hypothetical protein